ncbi:MAG: pyruvate kinase [Bacteroidetes bacterium]|nr:pyruvate kinase [Bacteroidota bacterium]
MIINRYNRTKIVATIGPASINEETLEKMIFAGMDVCRINSSHGDYAMMEKIIHTIRDLNKKLNAHIAILFDLQGPKIRIGDLLEKDIVLKNGDELLLNHREVPGSSTEVFIKYPHFHQDVKIGDTVLVDDGKIELEVTEILPDEKVKTKVIHGGPLSSRKGVNLPNTLISLPSLTEKDRNDLDFALKHDVEWIGLSFVRKPEDVIELKNIIKSRNSMTRVIAKIEKPEAVLNIDAIIQVSDGVMVARGDLGVEIAMERVPVIRKSNVKKCNAAAKPVIIATQMMESMIVNYRPTRAEANDVGNAVFDGADALMLSAETSVGVFPVETVSAMQRIISEVEDQDSIYFREHAPANDSPNFIPENICYISAVMAKQTDASAIVAMTHSGTTAFKIAAHRPKAFIYIFTDNRPLLNTLNLVWGIRGFYYDKYVSTDVTISDIKKYLVDKELVQQGHYIIHIASTPLQERSTANTIKLTKIE